MRKVLFILSLFTTLVSIGQNINFLSDANFRLYKFNSGTFEQIYYQPIRDLVISNNAVCFVDSKGDVIIHHDGNRYHVAETQNEIISTDNIILVRTASVLRIFDRGEVKLLSPNAISFAVGDSVVLFQDLIGGYLRYYYQGEVHEIAMIVGDYPILAGEVGANTFVFKDNAGNHQVFWRGKFYDLFNSRLPAMYSAGQDVVAFNDPQHNTFSVFENGYIYDLDGQFAKKFQAGDNFVYYKDAGEFHHVVREERVTDLGIDIENVHVTDSLVIYYDFGVTKVWYNEKIYTIYNMVLKEYQTDGGLIAWRNNVGGVSAFVRGVETDITNTRVDNFRITGNTIVLQYGPSAYSVWWNGKIYDF